MIFKCKKCGKCCKGYGGTYINENDILKISEYIGLEPIKFIEEFCVYSGSRLIISQSKDGNCIFFNKEQNCTIHPVKPYMCKAWPFINAIIFNPENWNVMAELCPGIKKDIPYDDLIKKVKKEQEKLGL